MSKLERARLEINEVDAQIAELFERRMKAVESVIEYKLENNLPIFDASREEQVIEKNSKLIKQEELIPYFKEFLHAQMDISKKYQQSILDKNK